MNSMANKQPAIFLQERQLTVYSDGSIYRAPSSDDVPACPNPPDPSQVACKDVLLNPSHGTSLRLFLPPTPPVSKLPVLLYFHGGAFVHFSPRAHLFHSYLCRLAAHIPALIIAPDYRLAPEHPLPAIYEDCFESLLWANTQASLGASADPWLASHADFSRCFICGDSAGGAATHYVAMQALGHGSWVSEHVQRPLDHVCIRGLLVFHPFFTCGREEESPAPDSREFKILKCINVASDDPLIDPLSRGAPSLTAAPLPSTCVFVAENDIRCRSRGLAYYEALLQAGKDPKLSCAEGEHHVFHIFKPDSPSVIPLLDEVRDFISTK